MKDRFKVLDELTRKIVVKGRITNKTLAREIARRWMKY
ncbi:MAG: hypothetical protein MAG795_00225 [Candidatus Woesearchaeota archaeon]|nr:hypothetical protein [Candidatus Woesearchaeota archaeon]